MRVTCVTLGHPETMNLMPAPGIVTGQNDDRCCGVHGVSVRATAKGKVKAPFEAHKICEGIVFPVVKHPADVAYLYGRCSACFGYTRRYGRLYVDF